MSERVTITIEPSLEHGDTLTVQDAMRQVLDFIEVVCAAADPDARSKIAWKLISATTNSPFTAVAEAEAIDPEWPDITREVKLAKVRTAEAFFAAHSTGELPDWVVQSANENFRRLMKRNMDGIGKTQLLLSDSEPPFIIVERVARQTLQHLEQIESNRRANEPDYSGSEFGSVEGHVIEALTHHGRPALRIRESVSDKEVLCVFPKDQADSIGSSHSWREVWAGQRINIVGLIKRAKNGSISIVEGEDLAKVAPTDAPLSSIMDSNITGGMGVVEYLEEIWGEPVGKN